MGFKLFIHDLLYGFFYLYIQKFLGASALHLAIAYNNNELVQELIEAGANVNQRAIGGNL